MSTLIAHPTIAIDDEPVLPISVEMYQEMMRLGLLDETPDVYLWNGSLVERMPPKPPHSDAVKATCERLTPLVPDGFDIDRERPMALALRPSAPQPDVAIIRGRFRDFSPNLFPSTAVALIVEVSDATLAKDRRNVATYAAEGIPIYWIVNLVERQLEVYADLAEGEYRSRIVLAQTDEVPVILDGREVGRLRVADLLP